MPEIEAVFAVVYHLRICLSGSMKQEAECVVISQFWMLLVYFNVLLYHPERLRLEPLVENWVKYLRDFNDFRVKATVISVGQNQNFGELCLIEI